MTCFSIQKSLILVLFLAVLVPVCAMAQAPEPPPEEIAKLKAADQAAADAKEGKVDAPIVIELYTSSDCTACVFADRIIYDAMKDKNVIALSCHIKDVSNIGSAGLRAGMHDEGKSTSEVRLKNDIEEATTAQQQAYGEEKVQEDNKIDAPMDPCIFRQWTFSPGRVNNDVTVGLPTFYFNGDGRINPSWMDYFSTMLRTYHYASKNKMLEVMVRWKDKDTISIHLPQKKSNKKKPDPVNGSVWLIRYKDMMVEHMDKGMNKGRVLRFSNIVEDIKHIGKWHGAMRTIDVDVAVPQGGKERGGYVVIVAPRLGEPYMAAGKLVDYPVAADLEATRAKIERAKESAEKKPSAVIANPPPVGPDTVPSATTPMEPVPPSVSPERAR
ncbi:MAG: hypothetical protein DI551_03020 [Micavibrio aeruginosavorus]|uniref:Thioredoxin-like fold domain-containing protein n=1 Tax=Micavibrio aeruginosavorus TaxID=349221 RepID=A0A2W5PSF6_9BACT|nr:MAG: hypothetical protein DI551_03020 [Micavibrio aeruginosavorus]